MSGRRPAEGQPEGQPPAKKAFDIEAIRAQVAAKRAAVEARLASTSGSASPAARDSPAPSKPGMDPSIAEKIAAAKARIDALNKKTKPVGPAAPAPSTGIALHPLLMADNVEASKEKNEKKALQNRYKTMAPKFSTVRANAAAVEEAAKAAAKAAPTPLVVTNPYTAVPEEGEAPVDGQRAPQRKSRKIAFATPGKYVKQGDQLRNEMKLEALKQRIAAQSIKAGLDSEFDVLERSLRRMVPPVVEWWDEAILPSGATYDDIPAAEEFIRTSRDSLVTHLIQHPIPIPAPSDRLQGERGLMLTKKEQRKMRRQRRLADLEDKRDRQKMGLIPPDPPKVRLANLMKVLTSDAVQDPTKVEAKVRREVDMRAFRHEKDNEGRKLSKEERHQKDYEKLLKAEAANGLIVRAYIIRYLTNGRHKFKIRETAKHDALTGLCIFHPNFAIVIVEGVAKKIKHYHQLMTHRIDWTEESRPQDERSDEESDAEKEKAAEGDGPDMSENMCQQLWEGAIPERQYKIFRARHAETDSEGKKWLGTYEGVWDLAKRWQFEKEDAD